MNRCLTGCRAWWDVYASIPGGGVWWFENKDGTNPRGQAIDAKADVVQAALARCGIPALVSLSARSSRHFSRMSASVSSASSSIPLLSAPTGDMRSWQRREQSRLARSTAFIASIDGAEFNLKQAAVNGWD